MRRVNAHTVLRRLPPKRLSISRSLAVKGPTPVRFDPLEAASDGGGVKVAIEAEAPHVFMGISVSLRRSNEVMGRADRKLPDASPTARKAKGLRRPIL